MAVQFDASINLPSITNGNNLSVSTDMGVAVAWTSTTSYSGSGSPTGNIQVGKGVSGNPIAGQVIRVDPDGFGAIINKGLIEVLANSANAPIPGGLCAVDGAGKVIAAAATAATCANARCIGYASSVNQGIFTHQTGTITPPTANVQSANQPEVCVIELS